MTGVSIKREIKKAAPQKRCPLLTDNKRELTTENGGDRLVGE